jgi:hypothetical protein
MQDPQQIWDFGRWIARRETGSARLSWSGGEIVLGVSQGRINTVEGLDPEKLAARLGCVGAGEAELLAEARALSDQHDIPETRSMGTAKELLQRALHEWLLDPDRGFDIETEPPIEVGGATISITHALVELVLADTDRNVAGIILPDPEIALQRSGAFLELYAPLRLSEEADLIVAGITGSSTVGAVASGSPHRPEEVVRLVAALVATGVLDATQPVVPSQDLEWPGTDLDIEETARRRIPIWLIGAAVALLVIVIAVSAWVLLSGSDDVEPAAASDAGDWGVVVEMGCEPQDLQRMLRKRNLERKTLRTVRADPNDGDSCFRLVWGSFSTRQAAEQALGEVPSNLIEDGFQPHVIEVPEGEPEAVDVAEGAS